MEWVIALATRLRTDGVDAILDQWDLKEGQDKYSFMESMVTDPTVDKVLAICDKRYAEKADKRHGGVGTESQIISREVYDKVNQEKFIPVLRERDEEGKECLPVFFKSRIYIDFSDDDGFDEAYEKLIRNLYGRPERKKPQLGAPPAHLFVDSTIQVKVVGKLERLRDAVQRQRPHTQVMLQEYLETFTEALEDFRVSVTDGDSVPFDERVVQSIDSFLPYRDSFVDLVLFVARYMDNEDSYASIHEFLEAILPYRSRPDSMLTGWRDEWTDNYRVMFYELYLYLIAALLKSKRYQPAAELIEGVYHHTETLGGSRYKNEGAWTFNYQSRTLDVYRKNRLNLNVYSVTADLIYRRSTHPRIKFGDILQADVLLFLRPSFPRPGVFEKWHPHCIGFTHGAGTLELFARATSKTGFGGIQHLLKVDSLQELGQQIAAFFKSERFKRVAGAAVFWDGDFSQLLNVERIERAIEGN